MEYTPPFQAGDLVGWSHRVSTQHGASSVLRRSAFVAQHPPSVLDEPGDPGTGQIGVVLGEAGRNLFEVQFDGDAVITLTADELVKLQDE